LADKDSSGVVRNHRISLKARFYLHLILQVYLSAVTTGFAPTACTADLLNSCQALEFQPSGYSPVLTFLISICNQPCELSLRVYQISWTIYDIFASLKGINCIGKAEARKLTLFLDPIKDKGNFTMSLERKITNSLLCPLLNRPCLNLNYLPSFAYEYIFSFCQVWLPVYRLSIVLIIQFLPKGTRFVYFSES
jgi:hypothetical protein